MNEKVNNESGDILPDDFTGMDDGLAGSSRSEEHTSELQSQR